MKAVEEEPGRPWSSRVSCRVVNETYDAETEMSESRDCDETETLDWSDGVETRPRCQCHQSETRRPKQRLETFG